MAIAGFVFFYCDGADDREAGAGDGADFGGGREDEEDDDAD